MKTEQEKRILSNTLISMLLSLDNETVEELCNKVSCETVNCGDCPFYDQDSMAATLQYLEVKDVD